MEYTGPTLRDIIYVAVLTSKNPFDFVGKIGKG